MTRTRGIVRSFNAAKGYGFIRPADAAKDVFVHFSAIETEGYRSLNAGDQVEFEVADGPKGREAAKVTLLEPEKSSKWAPGPQKA